MTKPKLLWHSNSPWSPTGYGQQTGLFTPRLAEHYDLRVSSFYGLEGAPLQWNGVRVLPGVGGTYGNEALPHHVKHFFGKPTDGMVVTLMDVWVLDPEMCSQLNMACWVPVDHDPAPPGVTGFLRRSQAIPIAMSRFGQERLAEFDPLYVPHAVDTSVFRPVERKLARKKLGLAQDAYVVGMVAANKGQPSRKCFPEALEAFAAFRREHENAVLYLHTDLDGTWSAGVNLPALIEQLEIPADAIVHIDPYVMHFAPLGDQGMATVFSAFDVLLNPSMGEGFGIPILEAQACFPAGTQVRVENPLAAQCRAYTGRLVKIDTVRGSFEATADHPVWTQRGWQSAGSVQPGDRLLYSHAPERLDQVRTGAIERVAQSVQDDVLRGSGSAGWDDARRGVLSASEPRAHAKAVLGIDRDEAIGYDSTGLALLRRFGGRRGYGDDSPDESRQGAKLQLQAVGVRGEHGQAHDGLDRGADSVVVGRYPSSDLGRSAFVPALRGRAGTFASLSSTSAVAGHQRRLDGGGHRVVRDPSVAITSGPLDEKAARDRVADPGTEYDTVTAVSERHVRDLPVYNFTTRSGVYEVGPGYLVHNCGVPVIVTDFSAMPEVAVAGWKVPTTRVWTSQRSWQASPSVLGILQSLGESWALSSAERKDLSDRARAHALKYDVELVMREFMLPALEQAQERLTARQEPVRLGLRAA